MGTGAGIVSQSKISKIFCIRSRDQTAHEASAIRAGVADAMRRSWTRPLSTIGSSVNLDPVLQDRQSRDPKPGPGLYAVRALALALAETPGAGGEIDRAIASCNQTRSMSASRSKPRMESWCL
jgi:hypothetical protein